MPKLSRSCRVFLTYLLALFCLSINISAQTAVYEVQDIAPGTISNTEVSYFPKKINDNGFIIGSKYSGFVNIAQYWVGSFEFPAANFSSVGYDATSSGVIVGRGNFSGINQRAFIYNSTARSFSWLPCPFPSQYGTFCEAYAINNNNLIVGTSDPLFVS